jgi:lactate 2-monooxygenase
MRQIYIQALQGGIKPQTTKFWKLRSEAEKKLKPEAFAYVDGSASTQSTELNNRKALDNWQIIPRMLADVEIAEFKMTREIFGKTFATPIIVSPIGVQGQLHAEADSGTAQAASNLGVIYTHSSAASMSLEKVAEEADFASGDELGWFQLYWPIDDDVAISILQRAKKAGYKALVVTLDTWILGWRPSDLDTGYNPFLTGKGVANVFSDPVFVEKYCEGKSPLREDATEEDIMAASIAAIGQLNPGVSRKWSDLPFLREHWGDGPIILKGIQTVTDASRAVEAGMDGIWVSNHGGRQVDGAIGSLQALVPIASYLRSITNRPKIIFDSGIRSGADIMKALGEYLSSIVLY